MLGPVSQWVVDYVSRVLKEESLVVWFDPERYYETLLPYLEEPNRVVIPYRGSYYEQRRAAEPHFNNLSAADRAKGKQLLLYVPAKQRDASPLLEFVLAGRALEVSLRSAAVGGLGSRIPEAAIDHFLSTKSPRLQDLDALAEQEEPSLLHAVFKTHSEQEILLKYLTDPAWEARVDERNAFSDLCDLCASAYGLRADGIGSHSQLRLAIMRHLLLSEFRHGLNPEPTALAAIPRPSVQQMEQVRKLLAALRSTAPDFYAECAHQVEQETGVAGWGVPVGSLPHFDTFPFAEQQALRWLERLVVDEANLDAAFQILDRGKACFWVKQDPSRMEQWAAAEWALQLCREADRIGEELKQAVGLSPADMVRRYSGEPHDWWRLDFAQRRLEAHLADMEHEFVLDRLVRGARDRYERTVGLMAERFDAALAERKFEFEDLPHQTDVYARWVEPLLAVGERVAYFLVDALRFEMGRDLYDSLTASEKRLEAGIATPPTVTPVGMAALMPGAEKGVELTAKGDRLALRVDGQVLQTAADRLAYLQSKVGAGVLADLTLDQLLSAGDARLRRAVEKKQLVVIRSQEIDAEGEQDNLHHARHAMTRVLKSLRRGIERVRRLGFTRVVVAADHGHLFGYERGDDQKMEAPSGQTLELHRRCWVGRHVTPPAYAHQFKASQLGLSGDLELVFPRGLAIFRKQGGAEAYFHGGISLQELVIPILSLRLESPQKATRGSDVRLAPGSDPVTNRAFKVDLLYASVIEPERTVRLTVLQGDQEVGEVMVAEGFNDQTKEVTLVSQKPNTVFLKLSSDLDGQGEFTVQVVDSRTGLVLAQRNLRYELI